MTRTPVFAETECGLATLATGGCKSGPAGP